MSTTKKCPTCGATGNKPCLTAAGKPAKRPHVGRVPAAEPVREASLVTEQARSNLAKIRSKAALVTDGRNRALRTFLQGAVYVVGFAVVLVLKPVLTDANGWSDFDWQQIGFALAQSAGMALLAYLGRTVLDPSKVPSLSPPQDKR